jgi:hypothetical protein
MTNKYTLLSLIAILLFGYTEATAQNALPKRTCGSHDAIMDYIQKNWDERYGPIQDAGSDQRLDYTVPTVNTDTTYTIPVVVHLVYLADNKYENITDELVRSQIEALNRDFNLLNDTSIVRPEFKDFVGNTKIRFELATVDPQGRPTTGITRKQSRPILLPDWNPISNNVKSAAFGGVAPWPWKRYVNIWVCDLNMNSRVCPTCVDICDTCGLLGGYAQAPKGLPNWTINLLGVDTDLSAQFADNTDGIVIDFRFFGQNNEFNKDYLNNSPVYSQGRTTIHEMGHYLGLRHTWGDYGVLFGNGCTYDDGIADTPNEELPYANYITPGNICGNIINSCNVPYPVDNIDYPDQQENYMNYSTDICYSMFTKEQVNMMRYALTDKRSQLIIKREINTATGIQSLSSAANGIEVFPNPGKGLLNIRQDFASADETIIQVYNIMGAVVKTERIAPGATNYSINMDGFAPAVYFLHFSSGLNSSTEKVVIQ